MRNMTGSEASWHDVKKNLKEFLNKIEQPTIFGTISSADTYNKKLQSLINNN